MQPDGGDDLSRRLSLVCRIARRLLRAGELAYEKGRFGRHRKRLSVEAQ